MTHERHALHDPIAADLAAVARIDAVAKILEVVCRTTRMGFSAVARVTGDRWVACAVRDQIAFGLQPGGELDIKTTICDAVRQTDRLVVIENVADDPTYRTHEAPEMYRFQSYISVPIRLPDGGFFGTLCALDRAPATLNTPETISMFQLFAELIGFHLSLREQLGASERDLVDERRRAELRDQFMAVLGHDLRNPLSAIQAGASLLGAMPLPDAGKRAVSVIRNSGARMSGLIENLLDFARGQLGEGLPVSLEPVDDLAVSVDEVITELRTSWPDRRIEVDLALERPIVVDRSRLAQLLSNLAANALTHGDPLAPVRVMARSDDNGFELAVANAGDPIPPDRFERLFQPFSRASEGPGKQGLGLGLFIASEIAKGHGGTLEVASTPAETRFTFRLPHRA